MISFCWLATVVTTWTLYTDQSLAFTGLTDENHEDLPQAGERINALTTSGDGKLEPWKTGRCNTVYACVSKWESSVWQKMCCMCVVWNSQQHMCKVSFCGLSSYYVQVSESQSVCMTIILPQCGKVSGTKSSADQWCSITSVNAPRDGCYDFLFTVKVRDTTVIWLRAHPTLSCPPSSPVCWALPGW